jgi:hypothetical protein
VEKASEAGNVSGKYAPFAVQYAKMMQKASKETNYLDNEKIRLEKLLKTSVLPNRSAVWFSY